MTPPASPAQNPTALITGATGGLGREFAAQLAAYGYDLVLAGRDAPALREMADALRAKHGCGTHVVTADLAASGAAAALAKDALALAPEIDLLVNNAGFGGYGPFAETDAERDAGMIRVNAEALTVLTRLLLPGMLARKRGRVLNVASTAAYQPGPLMAVYYATKAYVSSFSLALSQELRGTGVTVTCFSPGPTKTGFAKAANLGRSTLFRHYVMEAPRAVRIGLAACMAGKPEIIPGLRNKFLSFCTRLITRPMAARVAAYVQRAE